MTYSLVAVDMDGTLLNEKKQITEHTRSTIKKATDSGINVCLSTGRPLCGVRKFLEQLSLDSPVITCNGAAVIDPVGKIMIYSRLLQPEAAQKIWQQGLSYNTSMCIWAGDELFVNRFDERIDDYKRLSEVEPQLVRDFDELAQKGISKILWYDKAKNIDFFRQELDKKSSLYHVKYVTSDPRFLEFTDEHVSKGEALKRLGEYLGVPRENIMAIGDGENDLTMLEYAGLGVAMANASESIRERCRYITESNINDGAAKAIERFCLQTLQHR